MARRLRKEEVVTIEVLAEKGLSKRAIARQLGVADRTVRYHLERKADGAVDGRKGKVRRAAEHADAINVWWQDKLRQEQEARKRRDPHARPPNVLELHEFLVREQDYKGSYKSVLRFVRDTYPAPRRRTYRRVETPPGAQAQTDWGEFPRVDVGDGPEPLHAFLMTLSHSRMTKIVWQRSEDQLSWLSSHNAAFRGLKGIPAVNRIDNLKTGIARGAGAWGVINPTYRTYAKSVGFHVDACPPRAGNAKGKVEAKVRLGRLRIHPLDRRFAGIEELQAITDDRLDAWSRTSICPATGKTVRESWQEELLCLQTVPVLPEPFDIAINRPVHKDCTVRFENRAYTVPFRFVGRHLEVRGCSGRVQILGDGEVVVEYPRDTEERILIDPECYEGKATDRVLPPPPLGRMGRKLQEICETPVERRPIDLYAALAEVAR